MNIKRYLSVFLIALMALTVVSTAGVIAAPKAAAQPVGVTPIDVQYMPGKTYVFLPCQFNYHDKYAHVIGTPQHYEFLKGGTASVGLKTTDTQAVLNYVFFGTLWRLNGVTDTDMAKPCTITMKASYVIAAKGTADTRATFNVGNRQTQDLQSVIAEVSGADKIPVKMATKTFTYTGPVGDFFYKHSDDTAEGFMSASVSAINDVLLEPGAAQATASTTVYYITLTFN
jgi:hypothetical protein